jgi:hypothetical protein
MSDAPSQCPSCRAEFEGPVKTADVFGVTGALPDMWQCSRCRHKWREPSLTPTNRARPIHPFDGGQKKLPADTVLMPRTEHDAAIAAEREKLAALRADIAAAEHKVDAAMRAMVLAYGDILRAVSSIRGVAVGDAIVNSEDGA